MNAFDSPGYGESQPLFYARGYGVYLTTLLVGIHVAAVMACTLIVATGNGEWLERLTFSSAAVLYRFEVWRLVTYVLHHPPTFWFLLDMYFLYSFGREVEKFFGWIVFLKLYLALLLIPAFCLLIGEPSGFHLYYPNTVDGVIDGSNDLHFGVFALFAFIYPNVRFLLFQITALWWLLLLAAIYTLIHLSHHAWTPLFMLWSSVGIAFVGVRAAGAAGGFEFLENFRRSLPRRRTPATARGNTIVKPRARPRRAVEAGVSMNSPAGPANASAPAARDVHESIDPLLDKIAKHGLASLSASEKAALERARASLLRKDRRE